MQTVLSEQHWDTLADLAKDRKRKIAAIAYVTIDFLSMSKGDVLIVDASRCAIASGETKAQLLSELYETGVRIHSFRGLHAKVALMDGLAYIGSGNMSPNSRTNLTEAGLLTDEPSVVSNVRALLQGWQKRPTLSRHDIDKLCKIKVKRRSCPQFAKGSGAKRSSKRGTGTWLLSYVPVTRHQENADFIKGRNKAQRASKTDEMSWIRYSKSIKCFDDRARAGDIAICVDYESKPPVVYPPASLLRYHSGVKNKYIWWEPQPNAAFKHLGVPAFKKLLASVGIKWGVTASTRRQLTEAESKTLLRAWPRAGAKTRRNA